jgi:hypothetical protein
MLLLPGAPSVRRSDRVRGSRNRVPPWPPAHPSRPDCEPTPGERPSSSSLAARAPRLLAPRGSTSCSTGLKSGGNEDIAWNDELESGREPGDTSRSEGYGARSGRVLSAIRRTPRKSVTCLEEDASDRFGEGPRTRLRCNPREELNRSVSSRFAAARRSPRRERPPSQRRASKLAGMNRLPFRLSPP